MESSGPGLESIISGGLPKSISRHELKMKHIDVGVGLGIGPKIHKTKMIQKKPLFAGEGVSAGLALLARPKWVRLGRACRQGRKWDRLGWVWVAWFCRNL
jgi:hypothetical protein